MLGCSDKIVLVKIKFSCVLVYMYYNRNQHCETVLLGGGGRVNLKNVSNVFRPRVSKALPTSNFGFCVNLSIGQLLLFVRDALVRIRSDNPFFKIMFKLLS